MSSGYKQPCLFAFTLRPATFQVESTVLILFIPVANLRNIDINLVLALDALLSERSVTRAAKRIGLSQPAMSHALAKLRELLDDPLLIRMGRSMVLSERAETLRRQVDEVMSGLDRLFATRPLFEPHTSKQQLTIAATDYVQFVLLPALDRLLALEAPAISLVVRPLLLASVFEELRAGELDIAIGLVPTATLPELIHAAELFRDRFVGLAHRDHPALAEAAGKLDAAEYAALTHIVVSPRGVPGGFVDDALAELDLQRRVAITVPHFLVVPHMVAQSNHVALLAERVAQPFTRLLPLKLFSPPIAAEPVAIGMMWHRRTHDDAARSWLRDAIRRALSLHDEGNLHTLV